MRMRLPVLIVAGVLGTVFLFSGSLRIADVILRNPIVLFQQAVARLAGMLFPTASATAEPVSALPAPSDLSNPSAADPQARLAKAANASTLPVQTEAPRRVPRPQPQGETAARSISVSDRLRAEVPGATTRGAQLVVATRPAPRLELANDTVAVSLSIPTGVEPPALAQPPVSVQPPTDLQPPSGIVPPGGVPTLVDDLLPPGGIPSPGPLLAGVLPAGTIISPGGLAQLPGGIQLQLPGGNQPGQTQAGPIQAGPIQSGPIQINPGQPGPGQGGPVQIGPIQIGPIQINPVPR